MLHCSVRMNSCICSGLNNAGACSSVGGVSNTIWHFGSRGLVLPTRSARQLERNGSTNHSGVDEQYSNSAAFFGHCNGNEVVAQPTLFICELNKPVHCLGRSYGSKLTDQGLVGFACNPDWVQPTMYWPTHHFISLYLTSMFPA